LLVVHRYFDKYCKQRPALTSLLETAPGTVARVALTFVSVALIFALFRSPTVGAAAAVYHRLFVFRAGLGQPMHSEGLWITLFIAAIAQVISARNRWPALLNRVPAPALGFAYAMVICLALVIAPQTDKAFIYFQF
jgi:alginate O-acetyltransferase complex protein AlgI